MVAVNYGAPFEKECVAPISVPKASVYWILSSEKGGSALRRFLSINKTNVMQNQDVSC